MKLTTVILSVLLAVTPSLAMASELVPLDLTSSKVGYFAITIFVLAYALVMAEEFIHLRKSKPVILAAGITWAAIAFVYRDYAELVDLPEHAIRHNLLEYAELMLFLLVAMTYVNTMQERLVFDALRVKLVNSGLGFRAIFWITGLLAYFISPVADNLTTALLMCAVVLAVGGDNIKFVSVACINIVVAANAGGTFSPFGDITTLMVWQSGQVEFLGFLALFIPSAVNYLIPATIMHFSIPNKMPEACSETVKMKKGAVLIIILFLLTIITSVSFHNFLHLPPVIGMLTGLSYLQLLSYFIKRKDMKALTTEGFDVFQPIAKIEWDTLLFFYGVIACVGGIGFLGYLNLASGIMYTQWGATTANIIVGGLSAIVDNIPVMFAVLSMNPEMSTGQWLLVTLTAGVGGSLLSIGSAAGVALMGQARGVYTFFSHLKWMPVIALGYAASIYVHFLVNSELF